MGVLSQESSSFVLGVSMQCEIECILVGYFILLVIIRCFVGVYCLHT